MVGDRHFATALSGHSTRQARGGSLWSAQHNLMEARKQLWVGGALLNSSASHQQQAAMGACTSWCRTSHTFHTLSTPEDGECEKKKTLMGRR